MPGQHSIFFDALRSSFAGRLKVGERCATFDRPEDLSRLWRTSERQGEKDAWFSFTKYYQSSRISKFGEDIPESIKPKSHPVFDGSKRKTKDYSPIVLGNLSYFCPLESKIT